MAVNTLTLYMPGSSVGIQVYEGSQLHLILVSQGANSIPSAPGETVRADPFPQYVDDDELAEALAGVGDGAVASVNGQTGVVVLGAADVGAVSGADPRLSDARTPTAHTHPATEISDSTTVGRNVLTAANAAAARTAIGAGTASTKADVGLGSVDNTADTAKPVSTAQQTALDAKANLLTSTNSQSGTSYTLVIGDAGKVVETTNAAAVALTVPPNSSVAFGVGTSLVVRQYAAGQITLTPGAGVTLRSRGAALKTAGTYAELTLTKRATDEWIVSGDVTT